MDALREWSSDCEIGCRFRRRILGCLRLLEYRFGVLSEMHISDNTPIFLWKILRIFFSSFSGKSSAGIESFPLRWWEYDCGSLERRECVLGFVCQARDSLEPGAWSREPGAGSLSHRGPDVRHQTVRRQTLAVSPCGDDFYKNRAEDSSGSPLFERGWPSGREIECAAGA